MKRCLNIVIFLSLCLHLSAQKDHFIFISQSSGQPFYVRMGDKNYSSTPGGHIILAPLPDSLYSLYIGFPKNAVAEQLFRVPIQSKDRGFELKKADDGWQLSDLQTLQLIPAAAAARDRVDSGPKKTDTYSELMSDVVNDSAVLYGNAASLEAVKGVDTLVKKTDTLARNKSKVAKTKGVPARRKKPVAKQRDTVVSQADRLVASRDTLAGPGRLPGDSLFTTVTPVTAAEKDTVAVAMRTDTAAAAVAKDSTVIVPGISRYSSENVEEGKIIIYIDRTAPVSDTIRILIPRL